MPSENWIVEVLNELRANNLERDARCRDDSSSIWLNFSTNDYLDLARSPAVVAAAERCLGRWGAGARASRLIAGTLPCHEELESRIAVYKRRPAALVFGSGYAANLGIVSVLAGRGDMVAADRLAHASIIDAAILSRAGLTRFRHNDLDHLDCILKRKPAGGRCLVITESLFSMDGDLAPLSEMAGLCEEHGAMLMVDEAHSTGVFGPSCDTPVGSLSMGTMSKALGGYGGFVACSVLMRRLLVNRARSFIFSTAPPPAAVGAAIGAVDEIEAHPEWGGELLRRASAFRERLQAAGLDTGSSASQIVPVIARDNRKALSLSARLLESGILAPAIRPPSVPDGTARVRLSVTLAHSPANLERAADVIIESARTEGIL